MRTSLLCAATALALLCALCHSPALAAPAHELAGDGALHVTPAEVELVGPFDYRQLLVTGKLAAGGEVDLTRAATISGADALVERLPSGMLLARGDGQGSLTISYGKQQLVVPISVKGASAATGVDYRRDVAPVLSKLGCNAGTCHGSKEGKNGFKLSLRGYDVAYDLRSLTDDIAGRRFNRAAPAQSLMLLKPTGVVPHEGGVLMQPGDRYYDILRQWIAGGVKFDPQSPKVTSIEVLPKHVMIPLAEMSQQMKVITTYSDGAKRDVTAEAFIEPSDIEILDIDSGGLVTSLRRGEAAALARYEGAYAAARIVVMGDRSGYAWRETPAFNYIDELVYQKQRQVKVLPSDVCSDAEFIRRAYLDLTGLPPTTDAVRKFLADERPPRVKRDELIDQLVGSDEFVAHWTNKWADMLQVNTKFLGAQGAKALREWIRGQLADNRPYDEFCYDILTASGSNITNPPAAYYKILREPDVVMENTTQLFLATRFNCNKCHDHPFERWTQDQYYELSAFFAQIGRKEDPKFKGKKIGGTRVEKPVPLVEMIADTDKGEMKHERTGMVTPPKFPFEHGDMPAADAGRREQLARWITSAENPYFARSYVNRIWSYLTGTGLIEPIDDIRAGNPPSNPELLDRLTAEFVASGFDVRQLMTTICKSRTYQLSIRTNQWNEGDTVNYTRAKPRRLPAEVLFDAVHRVTGTPSRLPGLPAGARAAEIVDPNQKLKDGFLDMFGRPPRESACECERADSILLGPIMNLINGPTIADAITNGSNRITKLVNEQPDDRKLVEELFLAILNRPPTEQEIATGMAALKVDLFGDEVVAAERRLAELTARIDSQQTAWEQALAPPVWTPLELSDVKSDKGAKFTRLDDGSLFVEGPLAQDIYRAKAETKLARVTGLRIEALADDRLPSKGPGRAPNGNFVLNEFKATVAAGPLRLTAGKADFAQSGFPATYATDGNGGTGWAVSPELGKSHIAIFEVAGDDETGTQLTFELVQNYKDGKHNLGRFRISATDSPRPHTLNGPPQAIAAIVAISADKRTEQQRTALRDHHRRTRPELAAAEQKIAQLKARGAGNVRLVGAQDLAWALINSPAFLFNR